jgi:hypothetical protein
MVIVLPTSCNLLQRRNPALTAQFIAGSSDREAAAAAAPGQAGEILINRDTAR